MQASLALTALLMGLAGGPHCVAMCGAACAGIGRSGPGGGAGAIWTFQLGRMLGYSALGAIAAASVQAVGWLTTQSAAIRPVWTLFHLAVVALGLSLAWSARQPVWLESAGKALWRRVRAGVGGNTRAVPLVLGSLWALLPCGLLYSALLLAAMSADAANGAAAMTLFALGTGASMVGGPWLWLRMRSGPVGGWGVRLSGVALAGSSSWAIWMGLVHDQAPWCIGA